MKVMKGKKSISPTKVYFVSLLFLCLKRLLIYFMGRKINKNKMRKNEGSKSERETKRIRKQLREKKTYIRGNL